MWALFPFLTDLEEALHLHTAQALGPSWGLAKAAWQVRWQLTQQSTEELCIPGQVCGEGRCCTRPGTNGHTQGLRLQETKKGMDWEHRLSRRSLHGARAWEVAATARTLLSRYATCLQPEPQPWGMALGFEVGAGSTC